ncbi:hypothetical protein ACLESO_26090 [Pyxidicoccus sp. 3LG]
MPTCAPLCAFRSESEKDVSVSVTWDCNPRYAQADVHALLAPSLQAGGVECPRWAAPPSAALPRRACCR